MNNITKAITEVEGTSGTIYLYGYIGQRAWEKEEKVQDLSDVAVMQAIKSLEKKGCKTCHVRINSPGGSMLDGDGIINLLATTKLELHTYCDGMAASMAADIWMVAKKENRHIAKNGKLMIHAPLTYVGGNSVKLRKEAERLEKYESAAIAQMAQDTGMSEEAVKEQFYDGEDHWLVAADAVKLGLIAGADDYEAENLPANPEKMSYQDVVKFYDTTEKTAIEDNILKRIAAYIFPPQKETKAATPINPPTENIDTMTIEEIEKAIERGEVKKEELLERFAEKPEDKKKKKPLMEEEEEDDEKKVEKTLDTASFQALIEKAIQPLNKQISDLVAENQRLGALPGATPSGVPSTGDAHYDAPVSDAEKAAVIHNKAILDALRKGESVKIA